MKYIKKKFIITFVIVFISLIVIHVHSNAMIISATHPEGKVGEIVECVFTLNNFLTSETYFEGWITYSENVLELISITPTEGCNMYGTHVDIVRDSYDGPSTINIKVKCKIISNEYVGGTVGLSLTGSLTSGNGSSSITVTSNSEMERLQNLNNNVTSNNTLTTNNGDNSTNTSQNTTLNSAIENTTNNSSNDKPISNNTTTNTKSITNTSISAKGNSNVDIAQNSVVESTIDNIDVNNIVEASANVYGEDTLIDETIDSNTKILGVDNNSDENHKNKFILPIIIVGILIIGTSLVILCIRKIAKK